MDADCLIKITKAGLKNFVGSKYTIFIAEVVKTEKSILNKLASGPIS